MHPADKRALPFVELAFQGVLPSVGRRRVGASPDLLRAHQVAAPLHGLRNSRASHVTRRPESTAGIAASGRRRSRCSASHSLKEYCLCTSIHGLRYIAEDGRHWSERLLWVALWLLAVYCASFMVKEVADRYWNSPTMTVVEATNFPIADIPFPAVTICDTNRVRWSRALRFQKQHLSEVSKAAQEAFEVLFTAMNTMDFGDFDKIPVNFPSDNETLDELRHVNLTAVMLAVMPDCKEFFNELCWWRNADVNCCSIFELQRTEAGFCYSFNSETSESRIEETVDGKPLLRPRRTSNKGSWSGLRVAVNASKDLPSGSPSSGVRVMVHSPYSYPSDGAEVAAGQWASVDVAAQDTYTTPRVRALKPSYRGCLNRDEGSALGFRRYAHGNCMHQCQRDEAVKLCGCSSYHYPLIGNVPSCNVEGMLCLRQHNDVFNYMKPQAGNPYFEDDREGMECSCLSDCDAQSFSTAIYIAPLGAGYNPAPRRLHNMSQVVFLDIHFQSQFVVRYRTDLVFGWVDLVVSFGGIVGLFLGSSMLSVAEIIYHATLRYWCQLWREAQNRRQREAAFDTSGANCSSFVSSLRHSDTPPAVPLTHCHRARQLPGISISDAWLR